MTKTQLKKIMEYVEKEVDRRISEIDVSNDEILSKKIEEFARLSDEMTKLEAQMAILKKQIKPIDTELVAMIDGIEDTTERILETKNVIIKVTKKGVIGQKSPKYKEAFLYLLDRVNGKMKTLAEESLAANTTISNVKSSISAVWKKTENKQLTEISWKDIKNKLMSSFKKIFNITEPLNKDLINLQKLANKL